MQFTLTINCDNAMFYPNLDPDACVVCNRDRTTEDEDPYSVHDCDFPEPDAGELIRILNYTAQKIQDGVFDSNVRDSNGDIVGRFELKDDPDNRHPIVAMRDALKARGIETQDMSDPEVIDTFDDDSEADTAAAYDAVAQREHGEFYRKDK